MGKVIRMGMVFDEGSVPDFGSIYAVDLRHNGVNEYGGSDTDDVSKLDLITNAAPGSTCLFSNGTIYRREKTSWAKFGEEETTAASNSASPASLNLSPMDIDKAALTSDVSFDEGEGSALEAQKSAVTSSTADEVRV